ncbi:MAG: HAD family hydrolase [Rhodobacteraceae bacterium]|jgi:HAD superfamily hydrolase (TIGR01509 family)|uniref:HAD family hydrolase n=1 Tax=Planktotalea sp. TaxID=2029877 RepID=UPI001D34C41D|nr:HAD family hydrolase [Paracoccaceae bacterium]
MQMPPDMVIFDCDGVIVDSEGITDRVMQASFKRYGLQLETDEIARLFVGGTMQGAMDSAIKLGAALPNNWLDLIYPDIFEALEQEVEAIPGAIAVLDALDAACIPYAIGSNGPHAKMEVTLTRTGLIDRLKGRIYSREDVPNPKPAPDVYLLAAKNAGVSPDRCVVIEDSVSGAKAGVAAGMRTYGFYAETPKERLAPICDALFGDMADLRALLGLTK